MNSTERHQLKKINTFLNTISNQLRDELKTVISGDLGLIRDANGKDIEVVDFGFNEDGYTLFLHPMDAQNNQLGYKKLLNDYPNGIIRDNDLDLETSAYDFDDDDEMERLDSFYIQLRDDFIKWFSDCWDKAGGMNATLKFHLVAHDDEAYFDLKRKKWVAY